MVSKKRPDELSTTFFMEFHKKADVRPKKDQRIKMEIEKKTKRKTGKNISKPIKSGWRGLRCTN